MHPLLRMYEGVSHKGAALIAVVVPILNLPDDLDIYDEIYLGYPNYWNTMSMAVYTFLEQYDFTSKTIPSATMRAAAFPVRCRTFKRPRRAPLLPAALPSTAAAWTV